MTTFDPEALLADARRRHEAALERVNRTCARKGVQTATRREVYRDKSGGEFSWLFDGEDPDVVARDSRAIKRIFKLWQRSRKHGRMSTVTLPSKKSFTFDHDAMRVIRP